MAKKESLAGLLSPQLRVSRPVAACSRCRHAKIKCDGKLPACTSCERAGKANTCSGSNDDFAKGKERCYVAALEVALEKLQRHVAEAKVLQASNEFERDATTATYMFGPDHGLSSQRLASGRRIYRREASDVDNLVGDFGFLSVNATSRDFHGFNATMSFARLLLAASKNVDLPQAESRSLPARYTITPYIQHYLNHIFVLMPFFSETDLMASVSAVYADAGRYAKGTDHWMVRMVLAIAAADMSQEKGDRNWNLAHQHVSFALRYAEDVLRPGSMAGIQAILLLLQYSLLDPDLLSCWHLIGFASRVSVDLGLHSEPPAELRMSKDEKELRLRVFSCVYSLDRSISMAFERAFSFSDDSVSVNLPAAHQPTTSSDSGLGVKPQLFLQSLLPSLYLLDIRRIQSRVYQDTHSSNRSVWPSSTASSYTNTVLKDVQNWACCVPARTPTTQAVLFRLESLYSQITALAPSCRNPNIPEQSRILIFEYSIQYIDQLHPITRDSSWHSFLTLIDIRRVDFIGRQFVNAICASFDSILLGATAHKSSSLSPVTKLDRSVQCLPPLPPPPWISRPTSAIENCIRAIRCLGKTFDILVHSQRRFGNSYASLKSRFEKDSAALMNRLRMKQQELGTVQYITGGPPTQQQQCQHKLPPKDMSLDQASALQAPYPFPSWVDDDIPYQPQPTMGPPALLGHEPQRPNLLHQQDVTHQPRQEGLPSTWLMNPVPTGNHRVYGLPYGPVVPQNSADAESHLMNQNPLPGTSNESLAFQNPLR